MLITDVKYTLVGAPTKQVIANAVRSYYYNYYVLTEIHTDEGITGLGYLGGVNDLGPAAKAILETFTKLLIGKDPLARGEIWELLYHTTIRYGRRGLVIRAISTIDNALWDLAGRALKLPVYKLIGYHKKEVQSYASGGYYAADGSNDMGALKEEAARYKAEGYQAIKIKVGRMADVKDDIKRTAQIRELIGDDLGLMVDVNEAFDLNKALRYCEGVKDMDLYWIEEPFTPDDFVSLRELTKRTNIPIACGENAYLKYEFADLLEAGVRYINADATRCGGITEWLKIAALCEARGIPVVPHCAQEINVTCCACSAGAPMTEFFMPFWGGISSDIFPNQGAIKKQNGMLTPPDIPGLITDLDWSAVPKYRID